MDISEISPFNVIVDLYPNPSLALKASLTFMLLFRRIPQCHPYSTRVKQSVAQATLRPLLPPHGHAPEQTQAWMSQNPVGGQREAKWAETPAVADS